MARALVRSVAAMLWLASPYDNKYYKLTLSMLLISNDQCRRSISECARVFNMIFGWVLFYAGMYFRFTVCVFTDNMVKMLLKLRGSIKKYGDNVSLYFIFRQNLIFPQYYLLKHILILCVKFHCI